MITDKLPVTKWEYTIASCKGDFDSFGQNGWELVSVSDGTAYFKRPVIAEKLKYATTDDFSEALIKAVYSMYGK